jgi:hypothetical protein
MITRSQATRYVFKAPRRADVWGFCGRRGGLARGICGVPKRIIYPVDV